MIDYDTSKVQAELLLSRDKAFTEKIYNDIWFYLVELNFSGSVNEKELLDVLHKTLESLLVNLYHEKFNFKSSIKTYAYSIAKKQFYKHYHLKKKNKEISTLFDYQVIDEVDMEVYNYTENERKIFKVEFKNLSKKCRWLLRYTERNYTQVEIAKKMGYKNRYVVKNLILRCKKKLKKLIETNQNYIKP